MSTIKCKCCGCPMSSSEVAAYRERCESCWTGGIPTHNGWANLRAAERDEMAGLRLSLDWVSRKERKA